MLEDDSTASETFELYGPTNYSMAEIAELVDKEIYKRRRHINIPKPILKPIAKYLNQLIWWKTTSADEVEREFIDQQIDPKAKTFKDLGIEPAELKNYTFHYLVCYRTIRRADRTNDGYPFLSKAIEVRHTMISLRRQNGRKGRRRSICMSSMINDRANIGPAVALKVRGYAFIMYIDAANHKSKRRSQPDAFPPQILHSIERMCQDLML